MSTIPPDANETTISTGFEGYFASWPWAGIGFELKPVFK